MLRTTEAALTLAGALFFGLAVPVLAQSPLSHLGLTMEPRASLTKASPPLPDAATFPVQLVLDDDSTEGAFGFFAGSARQILWFNSFANPGDFTLEEIWVLFPNGADIPLGGAVDLVVYVDLDGDPSNGANLLATYNEVIQANDGDTFSVYTLPVPLEISSGDVLIGVVSRYFTTGVDPLPTLPAAYDSTASQGRSYFALWPGDPPDPPDLASADTVDVLAGAVSGNFMIRGFGTRSLITVPALDGLGLALLATILSLAGITFVRRRQLP